MSPAKNNDLYVATCFKSKNLLGIDLKMENGHAKVVNVRPGGQGAGAGIAVGDHLLSIRYGVDKVRVNYSGKDLNAISTKLRYLRNQHAGPSESFELVMWRGSWTRIPTLANGDYDLGKAAEEVVEAPAAPKDTPAMQRENNPFWVSLKAKEAKVAKAKTRSRSKTCPEKNLKEESPTKKRMLSDKSVNASPVSSPSKPHSFFEDAMNDLLQEASQAKSVTAQLFCQPEGPEGDADELLGLASGLLQHPNQLQYAIDRHNSSVIL